MCWAAVRLYGFRLTAVGEIFGSRRPVDSLHGHDPVRRIQSVTITEGPFYRMLDRVSVRVETAGGRAGQEGAASAREWLAPLIRRAGLVPLMADVMGDDLADGKPLTDWMPVHPRAFRRAVKRRVFLAIVIALAAAALVGWRGLIVAGVTIPVECAGVAALCRTPRLDGLQQPGRVQERVVLAQRDDCTGVADPGGDARRIAVRSPRLDGARPR
jgi:hypothetical protein